jgi:formate/nitrite transporter FocA (FNT family)
VAASTEQGAAQREESEQRAAPSAAIVHAAIRGEGDEELRRPAAALAWSGLAAGLSMGFSLVAEGVLTAYLPEADWRRIIAKLGYSVGFLIVVLGRQQLFTENTLTPILPLMERRDLPTLARVLRLWGVVLVSNVVGALLFALVAGHTSVFNADVRHAFAEIGLVSVQGGFWTLLLRGVFAGWLIALMVWLLPFAESGRVLVIVIITWLVGAAGFAHIIAGSVEGFYVASTGASSWSHVVAGALLPTLLGNIAGGVALVAAVNHAQVVAGGGLDS